jgi:predicted nucleotidyltransferase
VDADRLDDVARRHGIVLMVRFGSTITGRTHPGSDVALGVLRRDPPRSYRELGELTHDVHLLFPEAPVDLAILNRADPLFLKKVTGAAASCSAPPGACWRSSSTPPGDTRITRSTSPWSARP